AERACPFGMVVPDHLDFTPGQYLFSRMCMGLELARFQPSALPAGFVLRKATAADIDAFCAVDIEVFGGSLEHTRAWIAPAFSAPGYRHWFAEVAGQPV